MGAVYSLEVVDGKLNETELKKWFDDHKADCEYEYGNNAYNGTFSTLRGIRVVPRVFDNKQAADDFISTQAEKWGDAVAVRFKDRRTEQTKKPTFGVHDVEAWKRHHAHVNWLGYFEVRSIAFALSSDQPIPADQLTPAQKTKILNAWQKFTEKNQEYNQADAVVKRVIAKINDYKQSVTAEDYKTLKAHVRLCHKLQPAVEKLAAKLKEVDSNLSQKLYGVAEKDHGEQWLVGGVCAE